MGKNHNAQKFMRKVVTQHYQMTEVKIISRTSRNLTDESNR